VKRTLTLAACLALLASPAGADEIEDSIKLALEAYQAGNLVEAKSEIDYVAQLLAQKRAESLSDLLPAAFDGWSRKEVEEFATGASMFGGGLMAGATYEKDRMTVELQVIADSPAMTAMGAMFANPALAGTMGGKLRRVGGQKIIETNDGQLQALIANRFLIQVSGSASAEHKEAYFNAIDFAGLEVF